MNMKKLLSEILTDEMLIDIFNKLKKNESYEYSDDNMQFNISPNSISIQYKSTKPENLEEIRNSEDFKQFQKEVYAKLEEAQREYERGGELIDHDELFKSLLSSYE